MKKILMLSYYFPPITNVGSLRALGFAQHLPSFGWKAYVLSVKNPDLSLCSIGASQPQEIDATYCSSFLNFNRFTWKANGILRLLLRPLGIRLKGNVINELFCLPDEFTGWILSSYRTGLDLIKQHEIDVIYVSSKPFSSTLTGLMLKRATGKPLVLDFRDPASFPSSLFLNNLAGRTRQKIIAKIEEFILKNTDFLITTTQATEAQYRRLYPFLNDKIRTIYNGYYLPSDPDLPSEPFDIFTIVYMGNFYFELLPSDNFFEALRIISTQNLIPTGQIRFLYVGTLRDKDNWLLDAGRRFGITPLLETTGHVGRKQAQEILVKSSLMLLRIVPPMISTKLFEALRDGIPMLAIIEKGEVEDLISKYSPHSFVITNGKTAEVVDAILRAYNDWKDHKQTILPNEEYIHKFNKQSLTSELNEVLCQIRNFTT